MEPVANAPGASNGRPQPGTGSMASASPAVGRHRVVIVGGGFGGLYATKALDDKRIHVTLVDRRNFHLFQPLLYQVATGWLSPAEIASPLRKVFARRRNVEVLLGDAVAVDLANRRVRLADGGAVPWDSLIVSAGSVTSYFGNDGWREAAPGVKTIEDAIEIRRRLLLAFEAAEREMDRVARAARLTIVVIGGGATGVEMAGVIGELARDILRGEFRRIDPGEARVVLAHAGDRILPDFDDRLAGAAERDLHRLGVELRVGSRVVGVDDEGVDLRTGTATERIASQCVVWAAGVRANALADRLARAAGAVTDANGRVQVEPDLTLSEHPDVFAIGDMAAVRTSGDPLPGVAPVAMQQGRHVAGTIRRRLEGDAEPRAFHYRDRGTLATIGRGAAIAKMGPLAFDGFLAWIVWLFVHILYLVEYQNRVFVILRWAWDFFVHERGARLITGTGLKLRLRRPYPAPPETRPTEEATARAAVGGGPVAPRPAPVGRTFGTVRWQRRIVVVGQVPVRDR
jgi:NADH dehydrogenase